MNPPNKGEANMKSWRTVLTMLTGPAAPCELGFIRLRVERVGEDLIIAPLEK